MNALLPRYSAQEQDPSPTRSNQTICAVSESKRGQEKAGFSGPAISAYELVSLPKKGMSISVGDSHLSLAGQGSNSCNMFSNKESVSFCFSSKH
jgi:hypothetical protein